MTPDDLAALLKWLYANDDGSGWLPAAARSLRLNERNLRGMIGGKVTIPPAVALTVVLDAGARTLLQGWAGKVRELETAGISDDTRMWLAAARRFLAEGERRMATGREPRPPHEEEYQTWR